MSDDNEVINRQSWNSVKDAVNRYFRKHFNYHVNDYVSVSHNALPACINQMLCHVGVYGIIDENDRDDIEIMRDAYKQLQIEGKIGE